MKKLSFLILTLLVQTSFAAAKPNVILINADDLGIGLLGCYGGKAIKTPNIDKLAAEGMKFDNYYGAVFCAPSRWSLLTGMHFGRKGAWNHNYSGLLMEMDKAKIPKDEYTKQLNDFVAKSSQKIPKGEVFLAEVAQAVGYKTAQFGKLDVGFLTNHDRVKRFGWDHYIGYYSHQRAHGFYPPYLWKDGEKLPLQGNSSYNCAKMSEKGNEPVGSGGETYSQDIFIKGILDFIKKHKEQPFFIYHSTQLPHGPVAIPALHPSVENDDSLSLAEKKYASMVIMLDDHVGLIMEELTQLGIDDNTVVFFTSDNGHELYYGPKASFPKKLKNVASNLTDKKWRTSEAGDVFDGAGGRAGIKRTTYQGGVQCPLIVRWPGKVKPNSDTSLLSSHYDFMATLAELINSQSPKGKDSISYLPTLIGEPQDNTHDHVIIECKFNKMGKACIITHDSWKLIEIDRKKDQFQLYNIKTDIEERNNLAMDHPERVNQLKFILLRELNSTRPDLQILTVK